MELSNQVFYEVVLILLWAQLRDDLMTMLIAGHETTAAVLTWATYHLAQVDSSPFSEVLVHQDQPF